ncbi:MAG: PepSY domain-containing protein, partial [Saprospiraceae bacterium]
MKLSIFTTFLFMLFSASSITSQQLSDAARLIRNYLEAQENSARKKFPFEFEVTQDRIDPSSGIRSIEALQKIGGIYVLDGILSIHYGHYNRTYVNDQFATVKAVRGSYSLTAERAVELAHRHLNIPVPAILQTKERSTKEDAQTIFARTENTAGDIIARLMYIDNKQNLGLILSWEVQIHTLDRQHYWMVYIDANTGDVVFTEDKVLHCSFGEGLVYDASPEEQFLIDAQHNAMHLQSAQNWDSVMTQRNAENLKVIDNAQVESTTLVAPANSYLVLNLPAEAPND